MLLLFDRSHMIRMALIDDPNRSCTDLNKDSLAALMHCGEIDTTRIVDGSTNIPLPLAVAQVLASWSSVKQKIGEIKVNCIAFAAVLIICVAKSRD